MGDLVLVPLAVASLLALAAFAGSMPFSLAVAHGRTPPRSSLLRGAGLVVAGALIAGITVGIWLAVEFTDEAGALGQRSILEQMLPFLLALALTGCLIALPWRPGWVADELRRLGLAVPVVALAVLLFDGAVTSAGPMALLGPTTGLWLLTGAALLALGKLLQAGQRVR